MKIFTPLMLMVILLSGCTQTSKKEEVQIPGATRVQIETDKTNTPLGVTTQTGSSQVSTTPIHTPNK